MTDSMILDAIDAFLARGVAPHVHRLEHDDIYPEAIVARMRELGLFGATIAAEYGGLGLPCATYADIVERIARVWMSLTGIFNSHLIMAAIVQRNGTEAQKRAFLPRFASGELRQRLLKYHGDNVDRAFHLWSDAWVAPFPSITSGAR